jgi:purine catabolism regulator
MPIALSELLASPVVGRGRPVVLAGAQLLDREVRWVHSSDIFEIAPLLRTGDLLLTTGLGLHGRPDEELRTFVRRLAERGVCGLVLETCRFFTAAPEPMVAQARDVGLPLVAFEAVVPFVEVTEAINATIVDDAVHRLRHADEVSQALSSVLVGGGGVAEVLERLRPVVGATVRFRSGADGDSGAADDLPDAVPVTVHGAVAGWLCTRLDDRTRSLGEAALERAALAVSLAISRDDGRAATTMAARQHLAGLLLEPSPGGGAVRAALEAAGVPGGAAAYLTVVASAGSGERMAGVVERALAAVPAAGPAVIATAWGTRLLVSVLPATGDDPVRLGRDLVRALTATDAVRRLDGAAAVGPVALGVEDLSRSAREARVALDTVWAVAPGTRVVEARTVAAERALLRGHPDPLAELVQEQLGPLLTYDAERNGRLVDTLRAVLESADGKTGAARRLHVQRQTLYQRLGRIQQLLGVDLDDPGTRAGLLLALRANRLTANPPPVGGSFA